MKNYITVCLALVCTLQALPQLPTDCGEDRLTGVARVEGDNWSPDGCNNCRCLSSGRPGCTKRFCLTPSEAVCPDGERWEETTGDKITLCDCLGGNPVCKSKEDPTDSRISELQCGTDSEGRQRQVGDSWKESCNSCRCTGTGVTACTQMFCLQEEPRPLAQVCSDDRGNSRNKGEEWEESRGSCVCNGGVAFCMDNTVSHGAGDLGIPSTIRISFPSFEVDRRSAGTCLDSQGGEKSVGEVWTQNCNTCRCLGGRTSCTRKICPQTEDVSDENEESSFLLLVAGGDLPEAQCNQAGVIRCRAIRTNTNLLRNIRAGAVLSFLPESGVIMELRRNPEATASGGRSFALRLEDGGEANVVVGSNGSIFGSIKPITGSVHYNIESCGENCNVLLERDSGFFNQFKD